MASVDPKNHSKGRLTRSSAKGCGVTEKWQALEALLASYQILTRVSCHLPPSRIIKSSVSPLIFKGKSPCPERLERPAGPGPLISERPPARLPVRRWRLGSTRSLQPWGRRNEGGDRGDAGTPGHPARRPRWGRGHAELSLDDRHGQAEGDRDEVAPARGASLPHARSCRAHPARPR